MHHGKISLLTSCEIYMLYLINTDISTAIEVVLLIVQNYYYFYYNDITFYDAVVIKVFFSKLDNTCLYNVDNETLVSC